MPYFKISYPNNIVKYYQCEEEIVNRLSSLIHELHEVTQMSPMEVIALKTIPTFIDEKYLSKIEKNLDSPKIKK